MAKTKYLNSIAAILDNSQKPLGELLDGALVATLREWTLADLSLCKGPVLKLKKKYKGRTVMYNKVQRIIYIEDLPSCVLNDACGIYLEIKWKT